MRRLHALTALLRDAAGRDRVRRELEARGRGIRIGRRVEVRSPERLVLGSDVYVEPGVFLHCGGMDWSPEDGGISIGANTYIGPNSVLFGAAGIEMGAGVLISPGVVITTHQHSYRQAEVEIRHQPLRFGRIVIERDVWIGANATILPGVRLGAGSVVGAGAVVTRDVPSNTVVAGVPARVLGER